MDIVDPRIEDYAVRVTSPHDPLLAELSDETARELGSTSMLTGPVAGRLLEVIVQRPHQVCVVPGEVGIPGHGYQNLAGPARVRRVVR
jgi:predicted O-methyltransferase YrrM